MNFVRLQQFQPRNGIITVSVPASKSILNRALVLSALSDGTVALECGEYAEDTRALLGCLDALGIRTERNEDSLTVHGCGGDIPNKTAEIDVMSAGTAARFLTVALAFCGGNYRITASPQMQQRPMEVLALLEEAGVNVEYENKSGSFPLRLRSTGFSKDTLTVDTDTSTQYASGILLAASAQKRPFTLILTGNRTNGSYIGLTLNLLNSFGVRCTRKENEITVFPPLRAPKHLTIEPDVSGACYFYALSLLCSAKVLVRRLRADSAQGDMKFLDLLKERGVRFEQRDDGLLADGSQVTGFEGFCTNIIDFSDQALTLSALAPFALSPTRLTGLSHIRKQECDRVFAMQSNLARLGIETEVSDDGITVYPAPIREGTVNSFGDHRVAMSFSLAGLKTGLVTIENPECCKKTFDRFFEIVQSL